MEHAQVLSLKTLPMCVAQAVALLTTFVSSIEIAGKIAELKVTE